MKTEYIIFFIVIVISIYLIYYFDKESGKVNNEKQVENLWVNQNINDFYGKDFGSYVDSYNLGNANEIRPKYGSKWNIFSDKKPILEEI